MMILELKCYTFNMLFYLQIALARYHKKKYKMKFPMLLEATKGGGSITSVLFALSSIRIERERIMLLTVGPALSLLLSCPALCSFLLLQ